MSPLLNLILLTTLGSVIALLGGIVFLSVKKWSHALAQNSIPFAAGVLLATSLIGILPEAAEMIGEPAYLIVLFTFVAAYLFETLFFDLHHHEASGHSEHNGSVFLIMVGDSIHNFIDGVAIAASFIINPGLGLTTAIATFLHEVPHEIGDFGVMINAGYSKRAVFLMNLVSSLSSLVGALLVYFWLRDDHFTGILLAIAAGMFLYLGASDFLPKAGKMNSKLKSAAIFILGMAVMLVTLNITPHSH